ncbi:nucleotidyltransferase domain-containing protein [Vibrio renipiscarius]|uniref:Nucleotidyltransferase n=1 Tax=Vibrio renipiscarius TaxID=1461322 RepID=A0A0C2KHW3_9VIBR|nr:nucleotidyltransferase domain-containing protein [Vibrio renipiscarius]KII75607.1 nucleotidyltransferase [Vibrio renipiscarius]KII81943.1 nucleotidyltransferase [Vibrio renipiscarius]
MILTTIDPAQPFQPQYSKAIDDLVTFLRSGLGANLHSVYIFGSVAKKTATPHRSNLDVIVVTQQSFAQNRTALINSIRWRFQSSHAHITELSFKTALVSDIASLDSIFSWGFLLRHCAVCVYGENLSECFGDYEPSWEIAKHWNMDVEDWLAVYRHRIVRAKNDDEHLKAQQIIAKKLLRASYSLVIPRTKGWHDDPQICGQEFLRYYPMMQLEIERLSILLSNRVVAKRSVIGLLDSYGDWLVKQFKKTEFRIG